jgi:hypothetical protein
MRAGFKGKGNKVYYSLDRRRHGGSTFQSSAVEKMSTFLKGELRNSVYVTKSKS